MVIGIKYDNMHVGFTYPSMMKAFQEHCIELIGNNKDAYKILIKFLWGIKIYEFDRLSAEIESFDRLLKKFEHIPLSEKSLSYLEEAEKKNYNKNGQNIFNFFVSLGNGMFFNNVFIRKIQSAIEDGSSHISIGSMAVRPDMVEEYGWDWPNKIPEEIKSL